MSRTKVNYTNRIDRRAGQKGSRPSVRGQAEVEKNVTGHHYSEIASSGCHKRKGYELKTTTTTVPNFIVLFP